MTSSPAWGRTDQSRPHGPAGQPPGLHQGSNNRQSPPHRPIPTRTADHHWSHLQQRGELFPDSICGTVMIVPAWHIATRSSAPHGGISVQQRYVCLARKEGDHCAAVCNREGWLVSCPQCHCIHRCTAAYSLPRCEGVASPDMRTIGATCNATKT
jgi:hypothetical protein